MRGRGGRGSGRGRQARGPAAASPAAQSAARARAPSGTPVRGTSTPSSGTARSTPATQLPGAPGRRGTEGSSGSGLARTRQRTASLTPAPGAVFSDRGFRDLDPGSPDQVNTGLEKCKYNLLAFRQSLEAPRQWTWVPVFCQQLVTGTKQPSIRWLTPTRCTRVIVPHISASPKPSM